MEANCRLTRGRDGHIPIELTRSRNRNLSNKAYFQFARALVTADVRDNTMEISIGDACRIRGVPVAGQTAALSFSDLFDGFYRKYVMPDDNHEVSPSAALPGLKVIDDARSEESRVGKECVGTCGSRGSPYH